MSACSLHKQSKKHTLNASEPAQEYLTIVYMELTNEKIIELFDQYYGLDVTMDIMENGTKLCGENKKKIDIAHCFNCNTDKIHEDSYFVCP